MNLNQLWSGNDYALYEARGRNEEFRDNAQRVKVMRAFKQRLPGNDRESGFAEVQFLTDEGELDTNWRHPEGKGTVKARDIVMRWDEYVSEREHREAEVAERAQRREAERQRDNAQRQRLLDELEKHGIPRLWVSSITDYSINLTRATVEKELGLTNASN